jgi:dihydrofolate reductase
MKTQKLTLIVAMTPDGLIGSGGKIPWHLPEDLKRFKRLTTGHAIIMGRRTHESIGRPLPNRRNIVVTRGLAALAPEVERAPSFSEALTIARGADDSPFVIGGAEIYALALPFATDLEVTIVSPPREMRPDPTGGIFFPVKLHELFWDFQCVAASPSMQEMVGAQVMRTEASGGAEYLTFERRFP